MRIANRLLAFVVAVAVIASGVIVIVEVIAARSSSAPVIIQWHSMLRWGQRNTWKATSVELACAISAVAGLLLLLPQLRRRRPTRLPIEAGDVTVAALTRKGVAVTVRGAVADVEGISNTRVKVGHRRIRVNATSSAAETATARSLEPQVQEAVHRQLETLRLRRGRRLRVTVSGRRNGGQ